jgi:hypothetical protein
MEPAAKYAYRYLFGSMAYGFVRKVDEIANATISVREYDKEAREYFDRPVPMLTMDRISALFISTVASPWLLPVYLSNDLSLLEIQMRRANPKDYGYGKPKTSWIQYLF